MPDPVLPSLPAGTRLAHYVIERPVGVGAMGAVYAAHDTALDRTVAVKVVHPSLAGDREIATRFVLEARAAARVSDEHVTHIHFVGDEGGRVFYAMELVPGTNLEDLVRANGPLPFVEALDVLEQAARGLAAAHAAGFVHRDVKPSNLIRTPDGRVKVTDFGLAKALAAPTSATHVGSLVGTPDFMSPEQCRGDDVDARSDVYALGLTAFFLWTGRRPYERHALGALLDDQLHAPIPSACALRPELPPSVDEALARLCAKGPADRPATMADVARLLAAMRPRQLHLAPFMTRAFALLLDVVIFGILGAAVEKAYEVLRSYAHLPDLPAFAGEATAALILFASQFGMESRFGGSAGKLLLRLRVARADGARPSPAALLQRCLLRFPVVAIVWIPDPYAPYGEHAVNGLQMLALLAGALPFLTGRGLSLSDRLTKTRVILAIPSPELASPSGRAG